MDDKQWLLAGYPAGIAIFSVLCQAALHVPEDEDCNSSSTREAGKINAHSEKGYTVSEAQKDANHFYSQLNSEAQGPRPSFPKRSSLWFAAFWLILQYYALLRMGSKIQIVEHERPGSVWVALIVLFISTVAVWISAAKLADALVTLGAHQRSNDEQGGPLVPRVELVGFSFVLLLVPWVQLLYVLIWS